MTAVYLIKKLYIYFNYSLSNIHSRMIRILQIGKDIEERYRGLSECIEIFSDGIVQN